MAASTSLQGSCNCGRNTYFIIIPQDVNRQHAQVIFDDSTENRQAQAVPLTAWLRVPLSWYQSQTTSYFPDETHGEIRRTFTPLHAPHSRRTFCSFCGTHLSYWSEQPASEADYLSVTLGSLSKSGLEALEDLDLLPEDISPEQITDQAQTLTSAPGEVTRRARQGTSGDIQWFEDFISGSRLGRTERTRRGVETSEDGTKTVEWEVTEMVDDDSGTSIIASKRKYEGS